MTADWNPPPKPLKPKPTITGYRTLTDAEIAIMNRVKAKAEEVRELLAEVQAHNDIDGRWLAIGQTDLQKGFMAPTKYRVDFPERALELMRNGASLCEVAADLGISEETIHCWKRDGKHKAFTQALAAGTSLAQAWWEKLGRAGAQNALLIQPAVWIFTMKNRFGYSDKRETEISGKGGAPIAISWPLPKTELDD